MIKRTAVAALVAAFAFVAGQATGGASSDAATRKADPPQHGVGCFLPAPDKRVTYGYDYENTSADPLPVTVTVQITNPLRTISTTRYVSVVPPGEEVTGKGSFYRSKKLPRTVRVTFASAGAESITDACTL